MSSSTKNSFLKGTRQKVITGFIVASLSIAMASGITYYSFNELLQTVDRLAEPNIKLDALNNFFRNITSLDQQLRVTAIKNPKLATRTFLMESKSLATSLDKLEALQWSDSIQYQRLQKMRSVLQKRNKLFLRYLQSKLTFSQKTKTSIQLDSLSQFLIDYEPEADTNIVTTNKKTITTRYIPQKQTEKERGFFNRIFGKNKKKETDSTQQEVQEELLTTIDTVSMLKETKAIEEIGVIVKNLEEDKRLQNRIMVQREINFIDENTRLLNELLAVLREVEQEELNWIEINYAVASTLANKSTRLIGIVVLIFLLSSFVLIVLILVDITRTRYYRNQLIEAKEQAENLGKLKQQFLSNMSHELRTPLQSIIGFSELAKHQHPGDDTVVLIQKSSEHLLHIVNEVLDFNRIESGKIKLARESFSLNDILEEVFRSASVQAQNKGLDFTMEKVGISNPMLFGDAFRLRQILYNLLGNAIKFTPGGFVKLHVNVNEVDHQLVCKFIIEDSGIGISEDEQAKIFNEFEQANNSIQLRYGGSGIGLAIVKTIVEAQSGHIDVKSKLGEGTVFTVTLSFEKAPTFTTEITKRQQNEQLPFQGNVIVVDDDEMILQYCSAIFKKNLITHRVFNKAKNLLEQSPIENITHILIDIRMPEISGPDLFIALQKKWPSTIQFIAITAHVLPERQKELLALGFDAVLLKPFRESDLLNELQKKSTTQKEQYTNEEQSINVAALLKLSGGDTGALKEILQSFIDETTEDLEKLSVQLQQNDRYQIRETIHRLAGRTGQLGAIAVSLVLNHLELKLEKGIEVELLAEDILNSKEGVTQLIEEAKQIMAEKK